jgi:hypothetical protein
MMLKYFSYFLYVDDMSTATIFVLQQNFNYVLTNIYNLDKIAIWFGCAVH